MRIQGCSFLKLERRSCHLKMWLVQASKYVNLFLMKRMYLLSRYSFFFFQLLVGFSILYVIGPFVRPFKSIGRCACFICVVIIFWLIALNGILILAKLCCTILVFFSFSCISSFSCIFSSFNIIFLVSDKKIEALLYHCRVIVLPFNLYLLN